jgi:GTP cyclohydrolase II
MPIRSTEQADIVAFRAEEDAGEHVALLIGSPTGSPPLVRLHSECLTGDVFGSLKCDCGPQLDTALDVIAASGWGILLYLRQEGRAIGLINKLRAYQLQDQGFDTVDANLRLGFGDDERHFGVAATMLRLLGQEQVRLLTNNPRKVAGLEDEGSKSRSACRSRPGSTRTTRFTSTPNACAAATSSDLRRPARPERSRGAHAMSSCQHPSTSLGMSDSDHQSHFSSWRHHVRAMLAEALGMTGKAVRPGGEADDVGAGCCRAGHADR